MRVRVVEIVGTPEEIAQLDVEALLAGAPQTVVEPVVDPVDAAPVVQQILEETRSWPDVVLTPPKAEGGYWRLTRYPRKRGAFLYLWPRRRLCQFRLESSVADGCAFAKPRKVEASNRYQLTLRLNEESLPEALDLAKRAYETDA